MCLWSERGFKCNHEAGSNEFIQLLQSDIGGLT